MKTQFSVTMSPDIVTRLDEKIKPGTRSRKIEELVTAFVEDRLVLRDPADHDPELLEMLS